MSISESVETIRSFVETEAPGETWPSGRLRFDFNGVATTPARAQRKLLGLLSVVEVPVGAWGVGYRADGSTLVLPPGTHWFNNLQGEVSSVQLVDATRRRHEMEPVSGLTSDGWRVTLWVVILYEVADPLVAARAAGMRKSLEAAGRAAILAQMEAMTHQDLTGATWATEMGAEAHTTRMAGLREIEDGILSRLARRQGLEGLRIVETAIVERQGDERLVEIMRAAEVERKQVREERQTESERAELAQIQMATQAQTAAAARATALIEAETRARLAAVDEDLRLLAARTDVNVQEIRQAQEAREAERKRLAEEWRTAKQLDLQAMEYQHAQTLAIIEGTAKVAAEAAGAGLLHNEDTLWSAPQMGSTPEQMEVVGQGLRVLQGFREKIAPPMTRFLPQPEAGNAVQDRLTQESLRLARIRGADHELVLRNGELAVARIWFTAEAPEALREMTVELRCPAGYPLSTPLLATTVGEVLVEEPVSGWQPDLFLADLVRDLMVERLQATQIEAQETDAVNGDREKEE